MATFYVYECPDPADQFLGIDGAGHEYPSCTEGQGQWVEIDLTPWYLGAVDGQSFGALLSVSLLLMAAAYCVNLVVRAIRGRK